MAKLIVCEHPLIQEKLAGLRDKHTRPEEFRQMMEEAGALIGYEALRELPTRKTQVQTPLKTAQAEFLEQPVTFVAVLRAGLGLLPGLLRLVPEAGVGHIGLYRNEKTLSPVRYYVRLPRNIGDSFVVVCDPMLATGGSAVEAINILKTDGARRLALVTLLASRAGVKRVHEAHPGVPIYTAAVDAQLNKAGYIVPGLGDAGDRLFATS
ncbi:MAG: uracil phosphoribosyltransferase [Elusimicrobia bacterium]|nr:uracil phosphoribosyltransferase [Elusimicrobiota bacterium]MDE2236490.1 uracil phosphoribosyltransferase [Elusimicrobiota bacterium]MDE2426383.1 uracil phosphoribosyltransferase [Elusimicrobiota bacterium]